MRFPSRLLRRCIPAVRLNGWREGLGRRGLASIPGGAGDPDSGIGLRRPAGAIGGLPRCRPALRLFVADKILPVRAARKIFAVLALVVGFGGRCFGKAEVQKVSVSSGGRVRSYWLFVPERKDSGPRPLIV